VTTKRFALLDNQCTYAPSPNTSGKRAKTTLLVLHYTASNSLASSVAWLCEPAAKASAHLVVGRDGATAQLLDLDNVGWHAGRSEWRGQNAVNGFSIGVEIVNLGPLLVKPDGAYVSAAGAKPVAAADVFHGKHPTDALCPYVAWEKYPDAQLARVREIVALLRVKYPTITEVVAHSDVAPKRKIDTGAAMPADMLSYLPAV
jgi:N-acetylmuramoyl-L-alanine amidase